MAQSKEQQKKPSNEQGLGLDDVCFIISPIGKEGTENYNRFKEVLDYVIKPAIESSSMKLRIIRADSINRTGSFINDILQYIYSSFIVIVDLTEQNPNVFYELGVRHSLSPRTILIAQNLDDIPSDLREYRTIIYNTSAKGSHDFTRKIHDFITEIKKEPNRPDNPVLDRLPNLTEQKQGDLEEQISVLKSQISGLLSKPENSLEIGKKPPKKLDLDKKIKRILNLMHGEYQSITGGRFTKKIKENTISYTIPYEQGNFNLYFLLSQDGKAINDYWYISIDKYSELNIEEELADIRVLMERCSEGQDVNITFIVATDIDLKTEKVKITKAFNKIKSFIDEKSRNSFSLELWDKTGLLEKEKALGIRVTIS